MKGAPSRRKAYAFDHAPPLIGSTAVTPAPNRPTRNASASAALTRLVPGGSGSAAGSLDSLIPCSVIKRDSSASLSPGRVSRGNQSLRGRNPRKENLAREYGNARIVF